MSDSILKNAAVENFRKQVLETIRYRRLLEAGQRWVIAVSGGADSTALLHVLHSLVDKLSLQLTVVHVHHGLRGREADRDRDTVSAFAARLDLPFVEKEIVLREGVTDPGNLEDAARRGRYGALAEAVLETGAVGLATGHTLSDQAETVLHRLVRSAGAAGAQGIRPSVVLDGVRVIRPLIDRSRAEVLTYLQALGAEWCEDHTNQDAAYSRNRIRHRVLPELCSINPAVESALARHADIAAVDEAFLEASVRERAATLIREEDGELIVEVAALRDLPEAIRWRLWRHVAERLAGPADGAAGLRPRLLVNFEQIKQLERLVKSGEGRGVIQLREGIRVERKRGEIRGRRPDPRTTPES